MDEELSLQAAPDPLRSERANMARRLSCRGGARNRSCAPLPRGKRARNGVRGGKNKPAASIAPKSRHSRPSTLLRSALHLPPRTARGLACPIGPVGTYRILEPNHTAEVWGGGSN